MNIRQELVEEISRLVPIDEREAESKLVTLALLNEADELFDEGAVEHHVTASAFVVSERGMILHLHRRLGIWVQPGGHIDEGEKPAQAALRETLEETGLPVTLASPVEIFHVDVHPGPRGHTHYDVRYILTSPPVDPTPPPEESQEVYWFSFPEALERCEPSMRGAVSKLEAEMALRALAD
jgi:8-oxo-dGTP pyrophosphatase MutT (NUDIX family)